MQTVTLHSKSATLVANTPGALAWTGFDIQTALGDTILRSRARLRAFVTNNTSQSLYITATYTRIQIGHPVELNSGAPVGVVEPNSAGYVECGVMVPDVSSITLIALSAAAGTAQASVELSAAPVSAISGSGSSQLIGPAERGGLDYTPIHQTAAADYFGGTFFPLTYTVPVGKRAKLTSIFAEIAPTRSYPGTLLVEYVYNPGTTDIVIARRASAPHAFTELNRSGDILELESGWSFFVRVTNTDVGLQYYAFTGFYIRETF